MRIAFLLFTLAANGNRVPTDAARLNKFADEYNRYATEMKSGIVDVKQWKRVMEAWRELGN